MSNMRTYTNNGLRDCDALENWYAAKELGEMKNTPTKKQEKLFTQRECRFVSIGHWDEYLAN